MIYIQYTFVVGSTVIIVARRFVAKSSVVYESVSGNSKLRVF